jgi:predicted ATP-dependent endonuclease of OLD family
MFTKIHIERFRGIPTLDLDGLRPINLLVGKNNTGKTSVLEAILLLCRANNPFTPTYVGQLRGQRIASAGDADILWRSLFVDMTGKLPIEIVGSFDAEPIRLRIDPLEVTNSIQDFNEQPPVAFENEGNQRIGGLKLNYTLDGTTSVTTQVAYNPRTRQIEAPSSQRQGGDLVQAVFLSLRSLLNLNNDTKTFSYLVRNRQDQQVLDIIRLLDPRIQRLAVVSEASGASVYADLGGESLIPLAVCGEGMLRLFSIVLAVASTSGGMLLIDEIDNGLHYTVMSKLWPILQTLCSHHHVQLIATTHNEEMLHEGIKAFQEQPEAFAVFRLDRVTAGIKVAHYDGEVLKAVNEMGWEIRG